MINDKRIVISGSFSVGKTTLLHDLPFIHKIDSTERELIRLLNIDFNQLNQDQLENFQIQLAEKQHTEETQRNTFATDVGLLMCVAYTKHLPCGKKIRQLADRYFTAHGMYDNIFHIPIELPIEMDGVRTKDETRRNTIDQRLQETYQEYGIEPIIVS